MFRFPSTERDVEDVTELDFRGGFPHQNHEEGGKTNDFCLNLRGSEDTSTMNVLSCVRKKGEILSGEDESPNCFIW